MLSYTKQCLAQKCVGHDDPLTKCPVILFSVDPVLHTLHANVLWVRYAGSNEL